MGSAHYVAAHAYAFSVPGAVSGTLDPTGAVTVDIRKLGLASRAKDQTPCLTYLWRPHYYVEAMWHEDHCSLAFVLQLLCF